MPTVLCYYILGCDSALLVLLKCEQFTDFQLQMGQTKYTLTYEYWHITLAQSQCDKSHPYIFIFFLFLHQHLM